jgi:hypothetical protein
MNVITAADAANQGETNMITTVEETETAQDTATGDKPKAAKKAAAAKRARHGAPCKAKSGKKASPAKKGAQGAKKAGAARRPGKAAKDKGIREGSKTETILELLKRPGGISLQAIMKATGWQAHSVRGFLSGTIRKKMGLTVTSAKSENGERSYFVKA